MCKRRVYYDLLILPSSNFSTVKNSNVISFFFVFVFYHKLNKKMDRVVIALATSQSVKVAKATVK